jgi:hypothetical protein
MLGVRHAMTIGDADEMRHLRVIDHSTTHSARNTLRVNA